MSFIGPNFAWNFPLVSQIFLKRLLVFCILLFSSIYLYCSLRLSFLSLLFFETLHQDGYIFSFLLPFFSLSQLFVRPPEITVSPCCLSFSWRWFWSPPHIQFKKFLFTVLQALCLLDLIFWIYLLLLLYNFKGFDLGHTWMVYWFSLRFSV